MPTAENGWPLRTATACETVAMRYCMKVLLERRTRVAIQVQSGQLRAYDEDRAETVELEPLEGQAELAIAVAPQEILCEMGRRLGLRDGLRTGARGTSYFSNYSFATGKIRSRVIVRVLGPNSIRLECRHNLPVWLFKVLGWWCHRRWLLRQ
jgi:hypothetical protein